MFGKLRIWHDIGLYFIIIWSTQNSEYNSGSQHPHQKRCLEISLTKHNQVLPKTLIEVWERKARRRKAGKQCLKNYKYSFVEHHLCIEMEHMYILDCWLGTGVSAVGTSLKCSSFHSSGYLRVSTLSVLVRCWCIRGLSTKFWDTIFSLQKTELCSVVLLT